ncbi:phage holin family protein [Melaminivora alkalimesophila]|uniref:Putative superfamily III holin-X n=1 Tax=Melaminivora alkalimesophila TaxID=1165852 RepID=A0A317R968_9BURK|nr:phage holin family protein [Melaminivora alkalimesophila]PWW44691.1 putative superfamily III holin-X [Melaminivora alkalimesophila]
MNWLSLLGLEGWVARWRAAIIEGAIAAEDRLTLARLELDDFKRRLMQLVVLGIVFGALAMLALLLLSLAVLVQFWDSPQRALVAWLLAGGWTVACVGVLLAILSLARLLGNAFAFTRRELGNDWNLIKGKL